MRKLAVLTFLSLDGVMQAPGGKGEDPSDGFDLEGWTVPYFDKVLGEEMDEQMKEPSETLLGHKTYEIFKAYWPESEEEGADLINQAKRYVVSDGKVDTSWGETVQISGDVVTEIKELKEQDGPMLQVHGSSVLIQTLLANDLVDELWLKIFPVTLGKGKRLFGEGTQPEAFKLLECSATPSGVILAKYQRDGEIRLGSFS